MTQYIDQLLQVVGESDTPKKTLNTVLVTGFPNATPRPTLSSVAAPAAPMGIVQPEPGVISQAEETSLLGLPFGFAKNVAGGLGMLTQGLTSLVGAAGHDIYKGLASSVIPGEQSVEESPTALLGMLGAMTGYDEWMPTETSQGKVGSYLGIPTQLGLPEGEDAPSMIMEDMKARWGPLLRGDIGEFAEQLYEKPVSFGLDALMFAGGPGAAGRGAGYLAKGAPVFGLKLARPLTKSAGLTNVANYLNKFRVPAGAALGNRDVLYPMGGNIPVGVTPGGVYIPSIAEVSAIRNASVARRASINPLVRLAQRGIHNLASTKTVPGLGIPVTDALGMFDDPAKLDYLTTRLRTDLAAGKGLDYGNQLAVAKLLTDAASAHGFTTSPRLYQPWARRMNQTMLMRMRQAAHGAALIDLRELTNEYNRKFLDKIESADDVTFLEDLLNGSGDHRTPMDSSLWGYRNFTAESDMSAMGAEPYQLRWDAMFDGPPGRSVDIPDYANEPNMFEGMENIPRIEDRPQMLTQTESGLYPNPAVTDIAGGAGDVTRAQAAGLARGDRVMFYDGSQAKYLSTKPYTYSDGTVGPIDYFDFGNGPEMEPKLEWVKLEKGAQEGTETAAEMQSRLLGEEFAPRVGAATEKPITIAESKAFNAMRNKLQKRFPDLDPESIEELLNVNWSKYSRKEAEARTIKELGARNKARMAETPLDQPEVAPINAAEEVAKVEATPPNLDQYTIKELLDPKLFTDPGGAEAIYPHLWEYRKWYAEFNPDSPLLPAIEKRMAQLLDDADPLEANLIRNAYKHKEAVDKLNDLKNRYDALDEDPSPAAAAQWEKKIAQAEKNVEIARLNAEQAAANIRAPRPEGQHYVMGKGGGWTDNASTTYEQVVLRDGKKKITVILRNPSEATTKIKGVKVLRGTQVNKNGDTIGKARVIDTSLIESRKPLVMNKKYGELEPRDVQAVASIDEATEAAAQEEFARKMMEAEPPKVAETSDEMAAIVTANEKIQILRDQGIDVSQEQAAIIIAEEVQKAGGVMELAKAKPVAAKPSVAPAILKEGEGRAVWNGIELKPNTEHTMKVLGWKRNLKVTIKGETTLNDQLGIRYVRKTQKGGESSNFAPYNSIEAIDGKQRQVGPPRVAQPQAPAPAPTLKATAAAKPKEAPMPAPKATAAKAAPVPSESFSWADETAPGPWEPPQVLGVPPGEVLSGAVKPTRMVEPYTILNPDGSVKAVFATRDEALDFANVNGGDVVLPGMTDLPPLKVSEPTVPLTPPPVTPFKTIANDLPPEQVPRPTNLSLKAVGVRIFQALIGDKPGKNSEYRGAEMFSTPWYATSDKYRPARFFHFIDNMRRVDEYVNLDGQKTNARLIGVRNTLNDGGDIDPRYGAWRAYNAWFETPDGDVFEVQYLTPDMVAPIESTSHVWKRIDSVETEIAAHEAALKQIRQSIGDKKPTKAQLKEMADHAREMETLGDEVLALKRQGAGFNEAIVRELANPDGYDKRYKAFDQIRSNWYNQQTVPEFGHLPYSTLSASQQIDRSYIMQKVKKYDMWMFDLRKKMENIVGTIPEDVDLDVISMLKAMVVKNLDDMVKNSRHSEDLAKFENGPFADGIEAWVDAVIPSNTRTTDPIAYVLNRLDDFTSKAVEDGRATNKDVAFWQDMFNYRWQDIDAEFPMGVLPGYYPHIRMATKGPGGYLGRMHNLSALNSGEPEALRRATGSLARNRNFTSTRLLDSFEDYRGMKQFKNATADEIHLQRLNDAKQVVEDVYSLRATQLTRHRQVLDFIDEIKALSRPVTPMEMDMWKNGQGIAGYKLMNFDQVKTHVSIRSKMFDRLYKAMAEQPDFGASEGGVKGYDVLATQALKQVLDDAHEAAMRAMMDGTGAEGALYAVPEHLVSEFNRNVGRAMGWKVRFGVDAPMNVWKSLVLSFSPRWIVNNTIGNTIFTLIRNPGALQEMVRLRDEKYWNTMKYVFEGVFPEGVERGLFAKSTQRVTNYGFAESVAPRMADTYRTLRGQPTAMAMSIPEALKPGMSIYQRMARRTGKMSEGMRSFNTAIEDAFRTAVFSDQVRKMALKESLKGFGTDLQIFESIQKNPARKQEWIGKGITELNRTLGDYTNLTPVERNIFRRFILPFYPFYKHSAKFLLRLPIDHPFKATALLALGKLDAEMMKDFPQYLRGTVGMGWWGGQQILMRFRGMNPLTAVGDTQGFSGLNPVLQQILSYAYGINTYTGEPLTSGDVISDFSGNKIQVIRDDNGNVIGMKPLPDGYKVPPTAYRILQTMVPQVNVIGGLVAGFKGEDVGARYSGTGELIMDPDTGEPKYPQPWWKDPVSFLGTPLSTVDPYELAVDQMAKQEALQSAWNNRGDI